MTSSGVHPGVAALQRFVEHGLNGHRVEVVDEVFSPRFRDHHPLAVPGRAPERYGSVRTMRDTIAFLGGGADVRFTVEDAFGVGDRVAYRLFGEGVVRFPEGARVPRVAGLPLGAAQLTYRCVGIFALSDGRFVERWGPIAVG